MQVTAISDQEMQEQHGYTPPKIVDRSERRPDDTDEQLPAGGITSDHPLYRQANNKHVWGTLAGQSNPFLNGTMDKPDPKWENHAGWNEENATLSRAVTKHLQGEVDGSHPCVAIHQGALHQALDDGRLKNQFETGTSRGTLAPDLRGRFESDKFGYRYNDSLTDDNHPASARPIYGFLAHDPVINESADQYGQHTLVLKKPHVWHRTSTTFGDSLARRSALTPTPAQRVSLNSVALGYTDGSKDRLNQVLKAHLKYKTDDNYDARYTEAQFHGGVKTSDIHYAVLRGSEGSELDELKAHLDAKKVPWVHVERGYDDPNGEGDTPVSAIDKSARRVTSISDAEMQRRHGYTPPKIVDRSERRPRQFALPSLERPEDTQTDQLPSRGITPDHPLYQQWDNPHVWGSLAGQNNPFRYRHGIGESDNHWANSDGWDAKNSALADRVVAHLQRQVSRSHPCVAVHSDALHSVLDDGRLKSQFETNTSRGTLDHDTRGIFERDNFGYPHHGEDDWGDVDDDEPEPEHPPHARPIYGFLAHDPVTHRGADQYGSHTLVLKKPKVWHRTSMTSSDSLVEDSQAMSPSPVQRVGLRSADYGGGESRYSLSPEGELHGRLMARLQDKVDAEGYGHGYFEAQYHGGVSTNDIHYAILRGGGYGSPTEMSRLKSHLDAKKIPWVHVGNTFDHDKQEWADSAVDKSASRRAVDYQVMYVSAQGGAMNAPKVIAERILGSGVYLLDLGDGKGQIADTKRHILFPPCGRAGIIAHGYWEPVSDVDTADVLALVRPKGES